MTLPPQPVSARHPLIDRDARVLWHPATHFSDLDALPPIPIDRAEGAWLVTPDQRRYLDAIASWWTSVHGHCHPAIVDAVSRQVAALDHVMFAGFTHEPAVALAEALLERAPAGFGKVFFSDCGSASIEVALKLSFQARQQRNEPKRTRFAALHNSYHGETLGALAVCGHDAYRSLFSPLLMDVLYLPSPGLEHHDHRDLAAQAGADEDATRLAIAQLEAHADELTAVILEPLVQCAGRMTMTGSGYYRAIAHAAQRLGIHVIADEIAVGFGRTGKLFASDWAGVSPDLLCLSKGLSGGVLPLACTLIRAGFEEDFAGSPSRSFLHSHTFTGNPVACRAGLASLALFDDPATFAQIDQLVENLERWRHVVAESAPIRAHRQAGTIVAFDVDTTRLRAIPGDRLGFALRKAALERHVLLRPLHDTVYWMPPLCLKPDELERLAHVTIEIIREVSA
ncbi:MAG: adenosylmethionine--8-amino-7-oxononanoate transaminase [Myxococcales bacterium FL481]|nr:MAG: adenosylmethionine--8-amino-7-oxononanoate transaminase [Myxococcales bacterium FL481]